MQWSGPNRRRRLLAVGLFLALLAGGLTFLAVGRSRFAWDQACTLARRQLPGLLGADVGLGRCEVDPAGRTVRIYGLSATAPDGDRPTFSADELEITVAGVQPLSGRLELDRVRVIRPRIWLDLTRPRPPGGPGGRGAGRAPRGPEGRGCRRRAELADPPPRRRVPPPHLAGPHRPGQRTTAAGGRRSRGGG